MAIPLTEEQRDMIRRAAAPLHSADRDTFFTDVAAALAVQPMLGEQKMYFRPARSRRPHAARQQVGPPEVAARARPPETKRGWSAAYRGQSRRLDSAAKTRCAPVVPLAPGRQTKPLKSHKMAQLF
jgi:hypothetical protein